MVITIFSRVYFNRFSFHMFRISSKEMNNKSENGKVNMKFRLDQDSLGKVKIPADAYYGAFTGRAINQYHVTGNKSHKNLIEITIVFQNKNILNTIRI